MDIHDDIFTLREEWEMGDGKLLYDKLRQKADDLLRGKALGLGPWNSLPDTNSLWHYIYDYTREDELDEIAERAVKDRLLASGYFTAQEVRGMFGK